METWKDYLEKETKKCLESYDEFRKHIKIKTKSEWESMQEIVENVKDIDMGELLTEKEKLSQVETMDPAYQWMMRYSKYDDGKFTIKVAFTLDELEEKGFLKTETTIKDDKKKYFENLIKIAGDCIVEAGKKGKKFKASKEKPAYIASNKKYEFYLSLEPEKWFFGIYSNTQEDTLQCIKDIFESWSDKLDIELSSFDEKLLEWVAYKFSHFKNVIIQSPLID